jgi:hypothetical protein
MCYQMSGDVKILRRRRVEISTCSTLEKVNRRETHWVFLIRKNRTNRTGPWRKDTLLSEKRCGLANEEHKLFLVPSSGT